MRPVAALLSLAFVGMICRQAAWADDDSEFFEARHSPHPGRALLRVPFSAG